jgi:ParB family chromosome partitioning protein
MATNSQQNLEGRQRLGRGLAALLGNARPTEDVDELLQGVKHVPIEFVRSSSRNPRQLFNESDLEDLTASIRERGIIQPIIVRPVAGAADAYEIVAGERRWRAAQRAGKHTVPVIVLKLTDREALELSIVENIQRSDLNALEEARGYAQLASEYGYNHADIGRLIGKSRSHVANTLRLLALPEHVRELLTAGALTAGHARALLSVKDPDAVADRIVARGLTVRDVERLGSENSSSPKSKKEHSSIDASTKDLINRLSLSLGTEVGIYDNRRTREVRIRFRDHDQLEHICNKLLHIQ